MRIGDFERAGLRFEVDDEGPLDGPLVVLLHGFPTDRSSWRRVAPLLHDAGLRTIAPDQRGYSSGARPRGRAAYTSDQLVADVVALADAAGVGRFHVVGHDWGGGVAWLTAGQHADRVASVTSLSTPHPIATNRALRTSLDQARRSWYMAAIQLPRVPEWWFAPRMARTLAADGLPAEDAQRYAAHLAEPGALTAAMNWYRGALLTRGVAIAAGCQPLSCGVSATATSGRRRPRSRSSACSPTTDSPGCRMGTGCPSSLRGSAQRRSSTG